MRDVRLTVVDEPTLSQLLATAVNDADPSEVMAPVAGPPGWTSARREAFLAYHREHRTSAAQWPLVEVTYAVLDGPDVVGALRLAAVADDRAALEVGLWLGRSRRGRRIGAAALSAGADLARGVGAHVLLARTSSSNTAALALMLATGFRVQDPAAPRVSASLSLDPLPRSGSA